MDDLNLQARQSQQQMFINRVTCDKHEYITVTQTTSTTKNGVTEINKSNSWLQCKHCGKTIGADNMFL